MRRIYITLGVLLLGTIAMAYLYFSNLNTETNANDLSLKAASSNSAIIFSFENDKSFYDILSGQTLFNHVIGKDNSKLFVAIKENLLSNQTVINLFNGQKIYIGILASKNNEVDFLISTQSKNDISNVFKDLKNTKVKQIGDVYQLTFADSTSCFIAIKNQLAVISNNILQVQTAVSNNNKPQEFSNFIKNNSRFNKNTLASLYIDFSKAPSILKNILNSHINGELNIFNKQEAYAALSYNFSKERILFNGSTFINNENSYEALFRNVSEQKVTITNILPEKIANYTAYIIADYSNWQQGLTKWFQFKKEDALISKSLQQINDKYRIDLAEIFPKYFKNQLITFQLNSGEKFGAIALNNGEKVNQLLLDLSTEYSPDIRIFKEPNITYAYFGEPFKKFERPFYTIIDDYMIIANNASSVQSFLTSYKNDQLLINTEDYQQFSNQLSTAATISYYINYRNSSTIFSRNLKPSFYKHYQAELKNFDAFSYQLSGDKDKFLSNLLLHKKIEKSLIADTTKINP